MAIAASPQPADLLLRFLTLTGWDVQLRDDGRGLSGLATHPHEGGPLRVTAWGRSREAVSLLLFEQACKQLGVGSSGATG